MSVLTIDRAGTTPRSATAPRPAAAPCPAPPRLTQRLFSQRFLGLGLLASGLGLVPWLAVLAVTLPSATRVAWVGLDSLEALGLIVTGILVSRGDRRRALTAAATATLLLIDAWFDVTTASGSGLIEAIAMAALAEVPMAAICATIAWRSQ
ncbi:MAG TPA: hypothetical protein VN969_36335 [Streptosporangiaceae bacterium]|nr:hypothetical protein [Streptosporangiaceae bacterium]